MSPRTLAVTGALLLSLAVPAGAAAAPVFTAPLKPCYVTAGTSANPQGEPVDIAASGFTPGALVDVSIDNVPVEGAQGLQTDAAGAFAGFQLPAPFIGRGTREFAVTLTERGNPANTVTATARTTALGVDVKPRRAVPSKVISFSGNGFTADKPVYAHYVLRGRHVKTVKMSGNPDECGKWSKMAPQIPVRNPGAGIWTVQFDQLKNYRNPARAQSFPSVYVQLRIQVTIRRVSG